MLTPKVFLAHSLMVAALVSCGNDGQEASAPAAAPQQGFAMKSGELFDDDSDKMIGRYATTNPLMEKGGQKQAGEGENRANRLFEGEFAKREFAAKDYTKKSFWGSKEYAKQVYGGNTDGSRFQQGSDFGSKGAREGGRTSRASGERFATGTHATGAAREAGHAGIRSVSDAETDSRRRTYIQPSITDYRNQRGLTIDDTRSMLGRSD